MFSIYGTGTTVCRSTALVTTKVALRIDRKRDPTFTTDADLDLDPPAFQNPRATIAISIIGKKPPCKKALQFSVKSILLLIVKKKMYRIRSSRKVRRGIDYPGT